MPMSRGEVFGGRALGAVADEEQARGKFFGDAREDGDDVEDALDGAEVGEMHEKALVGLSVAGALARDEFGVADDRRRS